MAGNLLDGWFKFNLGEGAFYSVFGFIVVFIGIVLLIFILFLIGKVIEWVRGKKKGGAPARQDVPAPASPPAAEDEVPPEVVAAIAAALTEYYREEGATCGFVVRRIRKL